MNRPNQPRVSRTAILSSLAAPLILVACAPPGPPIRTQFLDTPVAQRSYVIGRFAASCEQRIGKCIQMFGSISLRYQNPQDSDASGALTSFDGAFSGGTRYDFEELDPRTTGQKGFYFCKALPAGQYAFYDMEFSAPGLGTTYEVKEGHHFNLPFRVSPGEIVYLGRMKITTSFNENWMGMLMPGPGVLLLSAEPESDIREALSKCPRSALTLPIRRAPLNASMANDHILIHDEPAP